jgi:hypothetical protein
MARERSGAARIVAQEGERVQVEHRGQRLTVPMRGFPPGFQLRPGARVILVDEPSGPVARPLVRVITSRLGRDAVRARGTLDVEGRRLEMQASTLVEEPPSRAEGRPTEEYEIWIVERDDAAATDQVIAARRRP